MSIAEKINRFRKKDLPPGVLGSMKKMLMSQVLSAAGEQVLDWVMAKPGRRFVFEHEPGDKGFAFYFEEDGKTVTPGFMGGSGE
jgi:hypothetical protein